MKSNTMKSTAKRAVSFAFVSIALMAAYVVTMLFGFNVFQDELAAADSSTEVSSSQYFYENLTYADSDGQEREFVLAKQFYEAIGKMHKDGDFKDGIVDYSLTDNNLATSDMIKAWVVDGNLSIPMAFSAARDAYYMDHPELFYIDIYKMTISAASVGDSYTAFIDSGREANLYAVGEFTSQAQVDKALTEFNAKVDAVVNYAKTQADKDTYGTAKKVLQARYANQYIATHTQYDDIAASNSAITTASSAQTAYGALVKEKSVCNGYSRAFKAVMDKLDIPCVVVGGYSVSKNSQGEITSIGEAHAWNYVWFETPVDDNSKARANDGAWYGYDVTWNSTGRSVTGYVDMGNFAMLREHSADGEISTSGYIVKYPELSNYNYGCKTDSNGIVHSMNYIDDVNEETGEFYLDDYGNKLVSCWETVSYNGKGVVRLFEEDGLRLIYRRANMGENGPQWTVWTDLYLETTEGPFSEKMAYGSAVAYIDSGNETTFYNNASILYSQYAVVSGIEPDTPMYPNLLDDTYIAGYGDSINIEDYVVVLSDMIVNEAYLTYVPAPHVVRSTPDHKEPNMISQSWAIPGTNLMDEEYAFEITVEYNEPLEVIDPSQPIGVTFTSASQYGSRTNIYDYASFVKLESGAYVEFVNDYTLRFKFLPSLMYEHNGMHYYFSFTNVGSAFVNYKADGTPYKSHKTPNIITQRFFRQYIACTKCLPNGRMLLDCVAQPTLISNSDLSVVNFQDENGNYYSAAQRSQMMLVVEKPTDAEKATMDNLLDGNEDINVNTDEIKSFDTYEIDLQICGRYTYIPNNSYVKIALGFPEGFGPESEGVTFKIYHYKRSADRKQIIGVEEIPCVVTKFGIVATVQSFSPFMIVAVDAEKTTDKTVYASINGNGGKLNQEDGQIRSLKEGESYTYTIAPDNGYQVYKVTLNEKDVTNKVVNGKLTLTYAELESNNEVEIKYISDEAMSRYEAKDVSLVDPVRVVIPVGAKVEVDSSALGQVVGGANTPNKPINTTLIIILVAVGVVVLSFAIGGGIAFVAYKKRRA